MRKYRGFIKLLSEIQLNLCTMILIVMVAINSIEIVRRTLLNTSFAWVQELSIILFCWLVFIGAGYIYNTSNLLNVDFLYSKVKGKVKLVWEIVTHILILCTLIVLIIFGSKFAMMQFAARTDALHLPFTFYSLPLVICALFMLLGFVNKVSLIIAEFKGVRKGELM